MKENFNYNNPLILSKNDIYGDSLDLDKSTNIDNNEDVQFVDVFDYENIDTYDALLYKWNGRNNQLTKHLATTRDNSYIRNVKSYLNNFDYYEERKYRK